jgi:ubiquinone/menaquinone biosynthesis C-methylase UbiE
MNFIIGRPLRCRDGTDYRGRRNGLKGSDPDGRTDMTSARARYQRIAPLYDLLDLPFEAVRYRHIRPLLWAGLSGRLLDAGVGTGRNILYYPPGARVVAIDQSAAMLARAERRRRATRAATLDLREMDATALALPDLSFDAAVATFLFCVLPDAEQQPALRELARVVRSGGEIRLLEYVRPKGAWRRFVAKLWEPWMRWAYGAGFDRHTEAHARAVGLVSVERRFLVPDLILYLRLRVPA